jgi:hypothetical protein
MAEDGISRADIAHKRGITPSYVSSLLKDDTETEASADALPATVERGIRPYSPRVVLARALMVAYEHRPARAMPESARMLWFEAVQSIAKTTAGFRLWYGPSSGYLDRKDFCELHEATEAELDILVQRGLLTEMDEGEGGLALPRGLGLTPRENSLRSSQQSANSPRRQFEMMQVLPGGRQDGHQTDAAGAETPPETTPKTPNISEFLCTNLSTTIPAESDEKLTTIPDGGLTHATTTTTKESDSNGLGSGGGTSTPRASAQDAAGTITEIPKKLTEIKLQRTPADDQQAVTELGEELARLAKLPTPLNPEHLAAVRTWRDAGLTREAMITVVNKVLTRPKKAVGKLAFGYLTGPMTDEIERLRLAAATPPLAAVEPTAPISDEDRALRERLQRPLKAWEQDKGCPFPPVLPSFKAALARGDGPLANRWLEVNEAWDRAGRRSGKPPDFTGLASNRAEFEQHLADAEDALTAPNLRHAAD